MENKKALIKSFDEIGQEYFGPGFDGDLCVQELAKAMATGLGYKTGMGDSTPLLLENLDATMTSVLFDNSHLKLFNSLPKVPAAQIYYEYNKRKGYGTSRGSVAFREGGVPKGGVSAFERLGKNIKFLGVKRGITHQLTTVGQRGGSQIDPVAEENRNGTLELLEKIERSLIHGDSTIKDNDGNSVMYDGILKQLTDGDSTQIIDLEGKYFTFEHIEEMAYEFYDKGKLANFSRIRSLMHGTILSDLSKLKMSAERKTLGVTNPVGGYIPGVPLKGFDTNFGTLPLEPHIFMDDVPDGKKQIVADANAPGAPANVTGAEAADTSSKMAAGDYYYFASAMNDFGESLATASAKITVSAAGKKVNLTIARVEGATGYRIYRGIKSDGSDARWIAKVTQPDSGNASHSDLNQWRPGTGMAIFYDTAPENLCIAQLAPLVKFPLAITSTTIEFLLLLYHTPVLKAPERMIVFKNIGRYDEKF